MANPPSKTRPNAPQPSRKPASTRFSRARPGVLVATCVGAVIFVVSGLTGHHETLAIGAFLFLGGGFVHLATKPAPRPPE